MDRVEVHKIVKILMEQVREEQRARLEALTGKIVRFTKPISTMDVEARIEELRTYVRGAEKPVH